MCDAATQGVISSVVSSKVAAGEMFTAYDVSLAVQESLKQSRAFNPSTHRHRHIKSDVHAAVEAACQGGQYDRNLQNVGAPTPAWVYYPIGGDPASYVPIPRNDGPAPAPVVAADPYTIQIPAPTPAQVANLPAPDPADSNDGDGVDFSRSPDSRGTLTVPAYLLRQAGFTPNAQAYVYIGQDNGKPILEIQNSARSGLDHVAVYTVDYCCNVRVTDSVLENLAEMNASNQRVTPSLFDFEGDSAQIVVRGSN